MRKKQRKLVTKEPGEKKPVTKDTAKPGEEKQRKLKHRGKKQKRLYKEATK